VDAMSLLRPAAQRVGCENAVAMGLQQLGRRNDARSGGEAAHGSDDEYDDDDERRWKHKIARLRTRSLSLLGAVKKSVVGDGGANGCEPPA
jgi:hypothetical protein